MTAIASLPATLKYALILRTVEGCSEAETAEILGVSQKAVKTQPHRSRATFRNLANILRGRSLLCVISVTPHGFEQRRQFMISVFERRHFLRGALDCRAEGRHGR